MILDDETDPKTKRAKPRVLDRLSVDELKDYVQDLKGEIARVEEEITKKDKQKGAIDALFKK